MLLLFESAAGYALFKVLKEGKLDEVNVRAAGEAAECLAFGGGVRFRRSADAG